MRLHWLLPKTNGIPVLMYHHVLPGEGDRLTVTPEQLRRQWTFLRDNGYVCLCLHRFLSVIRGDEPAPEKCFLLTFDDGYINNVNYAYPLLKEFGWSATFFVVGNTLDKNACPRFGQFEQLTIQQLAELDPETVQLAMHGYDHENFSELSTEDTVIAIRQMIEAFEGSGLCFNKVLAYPYGKRPKSEKKSHQLEAMLRYAGVEAAFSIGNKPQRIKSADPYNLNRIDIWGDDTTEDFIIKLQKGKLRPF